MKKALDQFYRRQIVRQGNTTTAQANLIKYLRSNNMFSLFQIEFHIFIMI